MRCASRGRWRGRWLAAGGASAAKDAAGGCVGRRSAPAAAVDFRLVVAESCCRAATPGPGHGPAAVAGGDCVVGGHQSSPAPLNAAERMGSPLGALVHRRAKCAGNCSKNSNGRAAPRAGTRSGAVDAADGAASGTPGAGPARGRATGCRAGACPCPSPIIRSFSLVEK